MVCGGLRALLRSCLVYECKKGAGLQPKKGAKAIACSRTLLTIASKWLQKNPFYSVCLPTDIGTFGGKRARARGLGALFASAGAVRAWMVILILQSTLTI